MTTKLYVSSPAAQSRWLAVITIGLATFAVVSTEMLPVGLLTPIADTLDTTTGTAGLMISLPALLAALFAPLVVLAAGRIDRRLILCALLALLALANLACALAPDMAWLLSARILVGLCMGGIWAIAGGLATRLVPLSSVGLANAIIFGGVAAASVFGIPLGAWIGDLLGWRWAFGVMTGLSALILLLQLLSVPPLPVADSTQVRQFLVQLGRRPLQRALLLTGLMVAGHFTAFTYIRPLLVSVSGFESHWLGALLFAYGVAGIAGNLLSGMLAAQRAELTLAAIAGGLLLSLLGFLFLGHSMTGAVAALLAWGLFYGGVSVGLMSLLIRTAPKAVEIITALYVGMFNIGIALGAWLGGLTSDTAGLTANLGLSAVLLTAALLLVLHIRRVQATA